MGLEKKELHIVYLDGVRGLAILLVWAGHFFNEYYPFQFGWIGVNLFFLLSGYLITGRLYALDAADEDGGRYLRNFYGRRILRIFPLYYGCLFVFFVILPVIYNRYGVNFSVLYREQWWYWAYLSNWNFFYYGYPGNVILVMLWSLAVEEQFYLLWPFVFRYLAQFGRVRIICCLWIISVVFRVFSANPVLSYFSTLTAAEPLVIGALLCVLEREGRLMVLRRAMIPALVAAVLVLGVVFAKDGDLTNRNEWLMRYGYTAIDLLLAGLLYGLLVGGRFLRGLFSAGWLCWLGIYSYGIYMFHWFILQMGVYRLQSAWGRAGADALFSYVAARVVGTLVLLLCSWVSYRYYERPFLRLKRYFV